MTDPFNALYIRYEPYVTGNARTLAAGDRDRADDLAQEAWLALVMLSPDRRANVPYAHTTMYIAMLNWLRRERALSVVTLKRRPPLPGDGPQLLTFRRIVPRHQITASPPQTLRRAA
jgi:DNA-directed RNA polymerase specialized sigma24 family protein